MEITLGQQYNVGEKPTVILSTVTLIVMQGNQKHSSKNITEAMLQYTIKHGIIIEMARQNHFTPRP